MAYVVGVEILNSCSETTEPFSNSKRIVGLRGGLRKLKKIFEV
jgi:hypothetical protein